MAVVYNPSLQMLAGQMPDITDSYNKSYEYGRDQEIKNQKLSEARALAGDISAYDPSQHGSLPEYLKSKGHIKEAYDYGKKEADIAKTNVEIKKEQYDSILKDFEIGGQVAQSLLQVPDGQLSADYAIKHVTNLSKQGVLRPEQVQGFQAKIQQTGGNEMAIRNAMQQLQQQAISSKDALVNHMKEKDQAITMRGQDMDYSLGKGNLSLNQNKADVDTEYKSRSLDLAQSRIDADLAYKAANINLARDKLDAEGKKAAAKKLPTINQGAIDSIDTAMESLKKIINHPGRESATGVGSVIPSFPGGDAAGFDARLETFKAQTFVPMVAQLKGMGALSDAEGKKLTAAVGALDPKMGDEEFKSSALEIMKELQLKRQRAMGDNSPRNMTSSGFDDAHLQAQAQKLGKDPEKIKAFLAWKAGQGG